MIDVITTRRIKYRPKATPTLKFPVIDARPDSFSKPTIFDGRGGAGKCNFQNILVIRKFRGHEEGYVNGVGGSGF